MTVIVEARYRSGFAWHKTAGALAQSIGRDGGEERKLRVKFGFFRPCTVTLLAALALAACQQQPQPQPKQSEAAPEAKPGIAVSDGVLVLPVVKGNPGAAYFTVANGGDTPTSLAAVAVGGADKAEMHETRGGAMEALKSVDLKPGETVRFERGGKHVMVFGIADTVMAGGRVEMTLTFAGGDKVSAPLKVEAAGGGGMADMPGMGHGGHD
jgi:copper(I)-binding protein